MSSTARRAGQSASGRKSGAVLERGEQHGEIGSPGEALRTRQWHLLTASLTPNMTAGIALISVAAAASDIATITCVDHALPL
jgi:hypothetical protein